MIKQTRKKNRLLTLTTILTVIFLLIFIFRSYMKNEEINKSLALYTEVKNRGNEEINKSLALYAEGKNKYKEDWFAYSKLSLANKFAYDNYAFCESKNDSICRGNAVNLANILEGKEFAKEVNQAILKFDDRKVNHATKN